jgi:nanoRNase/pAp phosphatase (c-di-AMP/oligoRNAs hydrolase)
MQVVGVLGCSQANIDYCTFVRMQMQLHLRNKNADVRLLVLVDVASQPAVTGPRQPFVASLQNVEYHK